MANLTLLRADGSYQTDDDARTVNMLRRLYIEARDQKRNHHDRWLRNWRLLNNLVGGATSSSWVPSPRDSEIMPVVSSLVGWMTDQEILPDITPATDPNSIFYDHQTSIANDLSDLLYSNWVVEHYKAQTKLALWDTFQTGAGILKTVWDQQRAGGKGNAILRRIDPWKFYPDPLATSFDDLEYCVEVYRLSMDEIERRFPDTYNRVSQSGAMDVVEERPGLAQNASGTIPLNPGPLAGAATRWNDGRRRNNQSTNRENETVYVYEFWIKENEKWETEYPGVPPAGRPPTRRHVAASWRCVVMAANVILMDEKAQDLCSHGSHPYERYVFDDIGDFYGIALIDHLAYPQLYINRLLAALQYNTELVGNPVFLEPTNSGLDRIGIVNRPGQRLPVKGNAMAAGAVPQWLTPPSMPAQALDLVQFWISRIENTSAMGALTKGGSVPGRNAAGVMLSIQEAAFIRVRSGLSNFEDTLEEASKKLCDLIIDNYDEERYMAILGDDGRMVSKAFAANHFTVPATNGPTPLQYSLTIKAGASAPTARQQRVEEADKLYAMGAIDDEAYLQMHQVAHIQEILQRKYDKIQKGLFSPPGARQRAQH